MAVEREFKAGIPSSRSWLSVTERRSMKNNTLAMLATISIVLGLANLIGYIDPAVCKGRQSGAFITCEQAAAQHIGGFWIFSGIGAAVLIAGSVREALRRKRELLASNNSPEPAQ